MLIYFETMKSQLINILIKLDEMYKWEITLLGRHIFRS